MGANSATPPPDGRHLPTIPVLTADPGWLVVEKPDGVSVHNEPRRDLCSLVQAMLVQDPALAARTRCAGAESVHAPHRLDRDTSGVVLLCCSAGALRFFGEAFQARRVAKCYLAVLHGRLAMPGQAGAWFYPLARSGAGRKDPVGRGRRDPCRTLFAVLGHSDHYTLAACFPQTGRRHQIRRHAKLAGHPVVGDRRYGSPRSLRFLRERAGLERLGLHAHGLELPLPDGAARRAVVSTGLPPDLADLLAADSNRPTAAWMAMPEPLADPAVWPERGLAAKGEAG